MTWSVGLSNYGRLRACSVPEGSGQVTKQNRNPLK